MFGKLVISHRKPGPDEENVTSPGLKLVRRHLLLPLKTRHQVVILNAMRTSSVVLYARGLCVSPVVEQYSSAGDASCFMPRLNSQLPIRLVNDFVFGCAIVKELLLLVREMTQAIPLGAFLCVEGDLCTAVSHQDPAISSRFEAYCVIEDMPWTSNGMGIYVFVPLKTGRLWVAQAPAKMHRKNGNRTSSRMQMIFGSRHTLG